MPKIDDLDTFRRTAIAWIERTLAEEPSGDPSLDPQQQREQRSLWWQAAMADGGFAGLTWPTAVGGRGLTPMHEFVFGDEADLRGAPIPANFLAMAMVGPAILRFGDEQQRRRHLPGILDGSVRWCIGFSEPGSGSDLASVATRAQREDDRYLVTGQKIWTSWAHVSQRSAMLARTGTSGPPHAGLTCLLAPLDDVEIRPIELINGDTDLNELFFDEVSVPVQDRLGDEGAGWPVVLEMLANERRSIPLKLQADTRRSSKELGRLIEELGRADDQAVVARYGRLTASAMALRASCLETVTALTDGRDPGGTALTLKVRWSRTMQAITELGWGLCVDAGLPPDDRRSLLWQDRYLRSRGNSIESGTDEVVLSIIGQTVLGLPRSR